MNQLFGKNVISIKATPDRSELTLVVLHEDGYHDSVNVRFFNSDKSPITIEFSYLSIGMIFDPDTKTMSLGEFEYVQPIKNGFEVFGDFGTIWVCCDSISPKL